MIRSTATRGRIVLVLTAAIAVLLLGATAVVAVHDFSDVPNSAFYHNAVHFLKDKDITAGCGGTKYCPQRDVTRGEMAVFLQKTALLAPRLRVSTGGSSQMITGTTFTAITGADAFIEVPKNNTARLLITFSGESLCTGGGIDSEWCSVTIKVDDVEADPQVGATFAFDSDDDGDAGVNSWEAHSMQRTITVGEGSHFIAVLARINSLGGDNSATFTIDDWTLSVQSFVDLT